MTSYFRFIIKHRLASLSVLALITIAALGVMTQGVLATSLGKLLLGASPGYSRYLERIKVFASDEIFIVAFDDDRILSKDSIEKLKRVVKEIKTIEVVSHVDSLLNAQSMSIEGDTLRVWTYAEEALAHPENRQKLLGELIKDNMVGGLLISGDGKRQSVMIELFPDETRPAETAPKMVKDVRRIFIEEGYDPDTIHQVGLLASLSEVMHQTKLNIAGIFPFVCLIMLMTVYLMFRRFWPVFITFVVSGVAVIWAIAFSVLLDKNISIFISMVPAVILIVATSDVIHLCSAYMLELGKNTRKKEAILKSCTDVGKACLLTSATTFFGFVSLSFVPTPAFKLLGVVLGFGVAVSLLLAMTISPILFHYLKRPDPWTDDRYKVQSWLSSLLHKINEWSTRQPVLITILFVLLLIASIAGVSQINIETDLARRMDETNWVRQDEEYYKKHFAGSTFLEVFIDAPEKKGLLKKEIFSKLVGAQERFTAYKEIDHAISFVDLIDDIHTRFYPGDDRPELKTLGQAHIAQYLLLFEMGGGENLNRMLDSEKKSMRLSMRLPDGGMRAAYEVGEKVGESADRIFGGSVGIEPSGASYLMGEWLGEMLNGQQKGLGFAFIMITILMIIGLKSTRVGLWSMIPNAIPILALGGYVGLMWDRVDSDTLGLAMIAIGIGVDDTIHFLMRFKIECQRGDGIDAALKRTFHFTGRAIVITTVILAAGFSPFIISGYFSTRIMATLLPMTLIMALLADLLLVPALVKLGWIRFGAT